MPWSHDGESFGFSASGASWLPVPSGWGALSVAAQQGDPESMLELTRRALRLRRTEPALGDGDLHWESAPDASCVVLRRPEDGTDPHVLVAMNLGDAPVFLEADEVLITSGAEPTPGREPATDPAGLVGAGPDRDDPDSAATGFWLPPDTAAWLR